MVTVVEELCIISYPIGQSMVAKYTFTCENKQLVILTN